MIGSTLSNYEITAKLGAGGMGEVYRARDTKLGREVAIKVLPESLTADPERVARFRREARLLASLNHPNIASIYGFEESDRIRFLVLELVEGETLAERVRRRRLAVEEGLEVCRQIAEALEAAHEKGVIHRDLKPANIQTTPDGTVKVLDFGLAKVLAGARRPEPSESELPDASTGSVKEPDELSLSTEDGVVLGTAPYMSPEQVRGESLDQRTDIWSFGCLLYELLTGKVLFEGTSKTDCVAAILQKEPDWKALPGGVPPTVRLLLRRCLAKDGSRRLHSIADARVELEEAIVDPEVSLRMLGVTRPAAPHRRMLLLAVAFIAAIAVVAGLAAWLMEHGQPGVSEPPLRKFELVTEDLSPIRPVISPDGRRIAYSSGRKLWVRDLDQLGALEIPGSEYVSLIFWSPDSTWVGFAVERRLFRVRAEGGEPAVVATVPDEFGEFDLGSGVAWLPDGRMVFTTGGTGLLVVSARGGEITSLLEPDRETELDFHEASPLPRGKGVLFVVHTETTQDVIEVFSGGTRKTVIRHKGEVLAYPGYSPTGHIVYYRVGRNFEIWAVPFSVATLEVTGESFRIVDRGVRPSVSMDGTLTFVKLTPKWDLVLVDRQGRVEKTIGQGRRYSGFAALSPDEKRVAIPVSEKGKRDIWIHDIAGGTHSRLTFDERWESRPAWSPDGKWLVFHAANPSGAFEPVILMKAADGSGKARTLVEGWAPTFSPDGKYLFYSAYSALRKYYDSDLWFLLLEGEGKPSAVVKSPAAELWGQLSPDGRYLAYMSGDDPFSRMEIYLTDFPVAESRWQVTHDGGWWPRWNGRGDKLYYAGRDGSLMEVDIGTDPSPRVGTPRKLFAREGEPSFRGSPTAFDVSRDGERFVILQRSEDSKEIPVVVENWFAEFQERSE